MNRNIPPRPAALALPCDIDTVTGGTIYDRRVLEGLRAAGREMALVRLPDGFPDPSPAAMAGALAALQALPADLPVIVDGLAFGALDPAGVALIRAPVVALVHHPLAHESGLPGDRARALHANEAATLRHAAEVVVPSPHTARVLVADYGVPEGRITIAAPGVDRPASAAAGPRPQPPLVLSVGLLHPRKGHDVLIAALERVKDLPWRAVIAGTEWDAAHAAVLRGMVAAPDLQGRVMLAGRVDGAALDALYRQASLFVLATRYEGYGMVFAEALVHGLPIVSCKVGAVPDTVPPGAGVLVPPDDVGAMAGALRAVLSDPARLAELAAGARAAAVSLPTWADTVAIFGTVLDRVAR